MAIKNKEVNKQNAKLKEILSAFKVVRKASLVKYLEEIEGASDAQRKADLFISQSNCSEYSYVGEALIKNSQCEQVASASLNAFDVYLALLLEYTRDDDYYRDIDIQVSKGLYPYDFVFSVGDSTILMINYDTNAPRKLNHHNFSNVVQMMREEDSKRDATTTILVVAFPASLDSDAISSVPIKGRFRYALIGDRPNTNNGKICVLSAVNTN